jgi:hypothetical protein
MAEMFTGPFTRYRGRLDCAAHAQVVDRGCMISAIDLLYKLCFNGTAPGTTSSGAYRYCPLTWAMFM